MRTNRSDVFDLVISGGGPAGLAAAIVAVRREKKVILLERSNRPGPVARGETIRPDAIHDELLGSGFMQKICLYQTPLRKFYSPGCKKSLEIRRPKPSYVFEWSSFIQRLTAQAKSLGVVLKMKQPVASPLVELERCTGVILADGTKIRGKTILDCNGYNSPLGQSVGINYNKMNCPIVKSVVKNFHSDYSGFELFMIAQGEIKEAPNFPPAIAYFFPRNKGKCETGLMVLTNAALKLSDNFSIPNDKEMLRVWKILTNTYPRISSLFKKTETESCLVTAIPVAEQIKQPIILPGMIHIGDSFGFIEASGASGLNTAMKQARFTVNWLCQQSRFEWTERTKQLFNKDFIEYKLTKEIHLKYKLILPAINFIFTTLKTPARINNFWWLVKLLYKFA